MQSVTLQPAYILHTRPYRDTSLLIELLTRDYGRVCLLARGGRVTKLGRRSRFQGLLQAFVPLLVSWRGTTELMHLNTTEIHGPSPNVAGQALFCGLYINELLLRLLQRHDPYPKLFQYYQQSLYDLFHQPQLSLCRFEKRLLTELGYALPLDCEFKSGCPIDPKKLYYFNPGQGLVYCQSHLTSHALLFRGAAILALDQGQFVQREDLQEAKRLLRLAIEHLLEGKPLRSRSLLLTKPIKNALLD